MKIVTVFILASVGCGGDPFYEQYNGPPIIDAGTDVNVIHIDPPIEASLTHDAATCSQPWITPLDASDAGPFAGCTVNSSPSTILPQFYAVATTQTAGCYLAYTPLACQCQETYTCACLKANVNVCGSGTWAGCDESLGAPTVTCE